MEMLWAMMSGSLLVIFLLAFVGIATTTRPRRYRHSKRRYWHLERPPQLTPDRRADRQGHGLER